MGGIIIKRAPRQEAGKVTTAGQSGVLLLLS